MPQKRASKPIPSRRAQTAHTKARASKGASAPAPAPRADASKPAKGMTPAMFKELQAVIGMANETNKLVTGYQVAIDQRFPPPLHLAK